MELYTVVKQECCTVDLTASSKDEVIKTLAELAARHPAVAAIGTDAVYQKLSAREAQGSTGFGNGIALPHARIEGLTEFIVALAVSPRGVDFDAMDKKKCRLIVTILGPAEQVTEHLKVLAAVSRILGNATTRSELINAPSATALHESFVRRVAGTEPGASDRRKMKLLVLILYLEDMLYDVMEFFLQEGIDGATILDGSGMGEYVSNVPLFAEFIGFMQERKNHSKTIIALVPEEREKRIVDGLESITGDMDTKQGAMVITLDVSFYKGSMRMM